MSLTFWYIHGTSGISLLDASKCLLKCHIDVYLKWQLPNIFVGGPCIGEYQSMGDAENNDVTFILNLSKFVQSLSNIKTETIFQLIC